MACDGVWDVMANDDACFFLRQSIQEGKRDLGNILEDMEVHTAVHVFFLTVFFFSRFFHLFLHHRG